MLSIPISEKTTIQDSDHQKNFKLKFYQLLDLYSSFAAPISILISLLIGTTLGEDTLKNNLLISFFFLIPLSHLSLLNFRLFSSIKNPDEKSLFHSILYSFLRFLFFSFSIISILLILAFYLGNPPEDIKFFSLFLVPFLFSSAYLLSTSCCLTPGSISFIDTGLDALLDILIFLSSLTNLVAWSQNQKFPPYLFFPTFLLVLLRSYNQRYRPSRKTQETTSWRKIVFATILGISLFIFFFFYAMILIGFLLFISNRFSKLPTKKTQ
ncbi:DUF2463 domain-containing protein [Encephalitozoon intestinalis]|nr:DUF2463 domain-containing protein [Encephalitozoon intestinalis]UTX45924.1 DUF2463 domain-containing protein [Encephalitozoon intestinalis]UTX46564.1 DUF2463 domain-containing protein [Encephalitozoon intestinalis]